MTTDVTAILRQGSHTLDLNSGRYSVGRDFIPPATINNATIGTGTSSNVAGTGVLIDRSAAIKQWIFTVRVKGNTDREVARGGEDLAAILGLAGNPIYPLLLEVKTNSDIDRTPIYGQDGRKRYEIIHADPPTLWGNWHDGRDSLAMYRVSCTISGQSLGNDQIVALAKGGVFEDRYWWKDGLNHGLYMDLNTTNYFPNPVFGYPGDYDNGWYDTTNVDRTETNDPEYVLMGRSAMIAVNRDTALARYVEYDIAVGAGTDWVLSFYVKLLDGSAVTTSHVKVIFNEDQQTPDKIVAVGDKGWYKVVYYAASTTATSVAYGVSIEPGVTVVLGFFQLENQRHASPPCYGDLLGHTWAGTAHSSTSTRAAPVVKIPVNSVMRAGEGTFRIAFETTFAYDERAGATLAKFFEGDIGEMSLDYIPGIQDFRFTEGINACDTAGFNHQEGSPYIFYCTYSQTTGLRIYSGGTVAASNGTYTPQNLSTGSYLFIGSNDSGAQQASAVIRDFTIWDIELTAAQIAADYANISELISDGQALSPIPFFWTGDGDNILDNCDDSTYTNWGVMCGIPGSAAAAAVYNATLSTGWDSIEQVLISINTHSAFASPGDAQIADFSGSADGNASGGSVSVTGVGTTGVAFTNTVSKPEAIRAIMGKSAHVFWRFKDYSAGTAAIQPSAQMNSTTMTGKYRAYATSTSYRYYLTDPITLYTQETAMDDQFSNYQSTFIWGGYAKRPTGGTVNMALDYLALLTRPLMRVTDPNGFLSDTKMVLADRRAIMHNGTRYGDALVADGDLLSPEPETFNHYVAYLGGPTSTPAKSATITFDSITITPRYWVI